MAPAFFRPSASTSECQAELRALFEQHGIACRLLPDFQAGGSELVFGREADVAQVEEILEACKNPKGS